MDDRDGPNEQPDDVERRDESAATPRHDDGATNPVEPVQASEDGSESELPSDVVAERDGDGVADAHAHAEADADAGDDGDPDAGADGDAHTDADAAADGDGDGASTVVLSKGPAFESGPAAVTANPGAESGIAFGAVDSAAPGADADADADSTVLLSKGPEPEPGPATVSVDGAGAGAGAGTGANEAASSNVPSPEVDSVQGAGTQTDSVMLSKGLPLVPGPVGRPDTGSPLETTAATDRGSDEPGDPTVSLTKRTNGPARAGSPAGVADSAPGSAPTLGDGLVAGPAATPVADADGGTARGRVLVLTALGVVVFLVAAIGTGALWSVRSGGTSAGPAAPGSTSSGAPALDTSYFDGLVEPEDVDGTADSGGGEVAQPSREVVYESLMSAKTPKLGEHAPSTFRDGIVGDTPFDTGTGQTDGGAWLKWIEPQADAKEHYAAFVDVTGDGIEDVVVAVGCYMGGTAMWPDNVVFYEVDASGGVTLLGGTSLGEISSTGRAGFESFTPTDAGIEVAWLAAVSGADEPTLWTADLTWTGSGLEVSNASPR